MASPVVHPGAVHGDELDREYGEGYEVYIGPCRTDAVDSGRDSEEQE